jgi:hypothetical protein
MQPCTTPPATSHQPPHYPNLTDTTTELTYVNTALHMLASGILVLVLALALAPPSALPPGNL